MSTRELIVLGTSSQVPTRHRNHNGYFLRWDDEGILFDPGEGTQRQMVYAELAASAITRICVTHFHGDHCLGLAGTFQRLSLDRVAHPVTVHYPASGQVFFDRLLGASIYHSTATIVPAPIADDGVIARTSGFTLSAARLDHPVQTFGYRLEEHSGRRFVPALLAAAGVSGPLVGELAKVGQVVVDGRTVAVEEVSVPKPGSAVAFVMDTRACPAAVALARDADLLVMEATYAAADQALATDHGHSSSIDAAKTAAAARAHRLALTHFSQRYASVETLHLVEARSIFPDSIVLHDLDRVPIPRRR